MLDYKNPIPAACTDFGKEQEFWGYVTKKKILVPAVGNSFSTGHRFFKLLRDITEMSDSFASCLKWILTMAYGGNMGTVDIIRKPTPGFSLRTEEDSSLSDNEKLEFIDILKSVDISLSDLVKVSNKLTQHYIESGNSYLHVKVSVVDNEVSVKLKVIHYLHAALRHTKPGQRKILAVCKNWSFDDNEEVKWTEIPVSYIGEEFEWQSLKNGQVFETVIHSKNELDEGDWYGRPWIRSVLNWLYSEHLGGDYRCRVDQNEVVAKYGWAFPKEEYTGDDEFCGECEEGVKEDLSVCGCMKNKKHPFDEKMEVLREITTVKGKKKKNSSMFGFEFEGDIPPEMYALMVNRDTAWFKEGLEQAANKIHKLMGVPRELAYDQQAKSGLGANTLINLYLIANCSTIEPLQSEMENYCSELLNGIFDLLKMDGPKAYGIKFNDKITPLVEAIKVTNSKENGK